MSATESPNSPADEGEASDSLKSYLEYNRILRTWFVAFGVGGPALFLLHNGLAKQLAKAGALRLVAACFLIGATAQVAMALLNKIANWYVYVGTIDDKLRGSCRHKFAEWLIGQFWIDIVLDIATVGLFGFAAWKLFTVFAVDG